MRVCPKRTRADEAIPNPNPSMFMIIKMPSSSPDYLQNNLSSSGPELDRPSLATWATRSIWLGFPLSKPPLDHIFSSRPELGRPSLAAGNAGDEVDLALFKHWAGAALLLRAVDEEELERFGRSASL